jgi:TPR repeat protein
MTVRRTPLDFLSMIVALCVPLGLASCDHSLEAKCKRGDGIACGVLGDRARHASDAPTDVIRACDFYRRACTAENYVSCANLGALLAQRKCPGTQGEALRVLESACDHDHIGGCNNLGMLLRDGAEDAPRNPARAAASFRRACPRAAIACDNLGAMLIETDEASATAAFQAGCDSRKDRDDLAVAGCCYKLGLSHENGWGVPPDKTRAKSLYVHSCAKSVREGCYHLGLLELAGDATELTKAAEHFRQACEMGVAGACNNMGLMYSNGKGVTPDAARAAEYLQRGCDGGELSACANVGSRYVLGDGVPVNAAKGRGLIAKACAGGVAEACVPPVPAKP